jgi:hypothetical protein
MTNRDLLKEAIADAKAVKETAIANAKAVLEEVFTKNLRAELASKLEEMDNDENKEVEEAMKAKEEKDTMKEFEVNEMRNEIEEEFDLNEILAELEEGEDKDELPEPPEEKLPVYEEDEEGEMEAGEMGDEEINLEDMTEDDLKSFIEDVIADMVAAGELEAGEEMEAEMGDMEAEEEMGDMEELDEMDEVSWKKKNGESLENLAPTKVGQTTVNEAEDVEEVTGASGGYDPGTRAGGGLENIINTLTALIKKGGAGAEKIYAELQQLAAASTSKMGTHSGADPTNEVEMDEMDKMEELKKELQEVNLLNAKLLYTNKIFNSKNLNESQKLRVLKAFDKAASVKEAKVIYETLNEGMVTKTTKTSMMNEIKGSASKATGFISESKQPIVEVDPMVARWQKLAGIK